MAKPNFEGTRPSTQNLSSQRAPGAFRPSKKARTSLSSNAAAEKNGVSPKRPATVKKRGVSPSPPALDKKAGAVSTGTPAAAWRGGTAPPARGGPPRGGDASDGGDAGTLALARLRHEFDALQPEKMRRINVYVPAAVAIVMGTLPKLMTLRDEFLGLPAGPGSLDKLETYALAVLHAHALTLPSSEGETHLRGLFGEATPLREKLLSCAELLARYGLLDATHVATIRSGAGYLDTAQDLNALAALYRNAWPAIASKTPVTWAEVERAGELGPQLVVAFGRRQQRTDGSGDPSVAQDRLVRAYTLFFNAYDDCRRAVAYLRWREGDADEFTPTLKPSRRRPRDAQGDEPGAEEPGDEAPGDEAPADSDAPEAVGAPEPA